MCKWDGHRRIDEFELGSAGPIESANLRRVFDLGPEHDIDPDPTYEEYGDTSRGLVISVSEGKIFDISCELSFSVDGSCVELIGLTLEELEGELDARFHRENDSSFFFLSTELSLQCMIWDGRVATISLIEL